MRRKTSKPARTVIGTTRRITGSPGGTGVSPVLHRNVLTAFGEPLAAAGTADTRYTYAGRFGYETPEQSFDPLTELGWLHVGERYYDPSVGRFVQRDPSGISGGFNIYTHVENVPTGAVDPSGLSPFWPNKGRIRYGPSSFRISARHTVKRLAFRIGPRIHIYGLAGGALFVSSCLTAAEIGYQTGKLINWGVRRYFGRTGWDMIFQYAWDGYYGVRPPGKGLLDY